MPSVGVNKMHLLFGLQQMYGSALEMLISEIFANALDVASTIIRVKLVVDKDGKKWAIFQNNGPPMEKSDFLRYNKIAESDKHFGFSLGYAGLGSKIYLGFWNDTVLITTSGDGKKTLSTKMFYDKKKKDMWWDWLNTNSKINGTEYKVLLREQDYTDFKKNGVEIIRSFFNTAMLLNGLQVYFENRRIDPWTPKAKDTFTKTIPIKNRKVPLKLTMFLTEDDIPEDRLNVEYHVSGKKIVIHKKNSLLGNVKKQFQKKFVVIVDSIGISDCLSLNKHSFKKGFFGTTVEPEVEKVISVILQENGMLDESDKQKTLKNRFTSAFTKVIEDYKDLIPDALFGIGHKGKNKGRGKGKIIHKPSGQKNKSKDRENKPRKKGGLQIDLVDKPDDPRQGWINPISKKLCVNVGHMVALSVDGTKEGKEYHILRIICSVLLTAASASGKYTVEKASTITDEIFEKMVHAMENLKIKSQDVFSAKQQKRDNEGKFLKNSKNGDLDEWEN